MKRTYRQWVFGLALCALLPLVTAGSKPLKERPFQSRGEATLLMNLDNGTWTEITSGVATHLGAFTGTASGDLSGGTGTVTAANGDMIDWSVVFEENDIDFDNMTVLTTGTLFWRALPPIFQRQFQFRSMASVDRGISHFANVAIHNSHIHFTMVD